MSKWNLENVKRKSINNYDDSAQWNSRKVERYLENIENGMLNEGPSPFSSGNRNLRKDNLKFQFTERELQEIQKCKDDICYFAEKYCKLTTDDGISNIKLREYQKRILKTYKENRFISFIASRQTGKTTSSAMYIMWYNIFKQDRNTYVTANKLDTATEVLQKIRMIYENLPFFLKPGVKKYNEKELVLDNGNRIIGAATTENPGLGFTIHLLYCDEFAHIPPNIVDAFYRSIYPTLSSSKVSQMIITSTPNGLNKFYEIYNGAVTGKNSFTPLRVDWWEVPGRDEAWKQQEIANFGIEFFRQEYECQFVTDNTMLLPHSLLTYFRRLKKPFQWVKLPELENDDIKYDNLLWDTSYDVTNLRNETIVISMDLAEGVGLDYTVMNIFKVEPISDSDIRAEKSLNSLQSAFRLRQIGIYRNNSINISDFSLLARKIVFGIFDTETTRIIIETNRNEGYFLFEKFNTHKDFYDDLILHTKHSAASEILKPGIRMNPALKQYYTTEIKQIFLQKRIILLEENSIKEAGEFGKTKKGNYKCLIGNDDIMMSCVNLTSLFQHQDFEEFCSILFENLPDNKKKLIMKKLEMDIDEIGIDSTDIDYSSFADIIMSA